jgi:diacylglycerol kinase family enzyme
VNLGLIALGSSNDIAREFDLLDLDRACQALKRGKTRCIDLGVVEHGGKILRYFIGQANIGLGARVNRHVKEITEKNPRLARFQSLAGTVGIIRSYRDKEIPVPLTVRADGWQKDGFYIVANFSNIRYWATGRMLNPAAGRTMAGWTANPGCSFSRLARLLPWPRENTPAPEVNFSKLRFEVSSKEFSQADGEIIGG